MDKREAQEVVNETVSGLVGGCIMALMVIAALPFVGWALLIVGLNLPIVLVCAAAVLLLGAIFAGVAMFDDWWTGGRKARRDAWIAAGGGQPKPHFLSAREQEAKDAWERGHAEWLERVSRRRPATKEIVR